ncbi:MAG: T9SS type A sorting domain-containing protein, partial [Bacteroidota bacterium]
DINIISIEVLNTYGQTLYTIKKSENKNIKKIDLYDYPNGIYLIKMTGRDFTAVEKIIKQ